jgi:anaerobic selenocysteine-containing dehydrogenase
MGEWGPGIERHTQGTDAAAAVSFLCITLGWVNWSRGTGLWLQSANCGRSSKAAFFRKADVRLGAKIKIYATSLQANRIKDLPLA